MKKLVLSVVIGLFVASNSAVAQTTTVISPAVDAGIDTDTASDTDTGMEFAEFTPPATLKEFCSLKDECNKATDKQKAEKKREWARKDREHEAAQDDAIEDQARKNEVLQNFKNAVTVVVNNHSDALKAKDLKDNEQDEKIKALENAPTFTQAPVQRSTPPTVGTFNSPIGLEFGAIAKLSPNLRDTSAFVGIQLRPSRGFFLILDGILGYDIHNGELAYGWKAGMMFWPKWRLGIGAMAFASKSLVGDKGTWEIGGVAEVRVNLTKATKTRFFVLGYAGLGAEGAMTEKAMSDGILTKRTWAPGYQFGIGLGVSTHNYVQ